MHESEKLKWSRLVVSDPQRPHGLQSTSSSIYGIFQARVLEWGAIAFSEMGLEMPKLLLVDSQYEESYVLREHV